MSMSRLEMKSVIPFTRQSWNDGLSNKDSNLLWLIIIMIIAVIIAINKAQARHQRQCRKKSAYNSKDRLLAPHWPATKPLPNISSILRQESVSLFTFARSNLWSFTEIVWFRWRCRLPQNYLWSPSHSISTKKPRQRSNELSKRAN